MSDALWQAVQAGFRTWTGIALGDWRRELIVNGLRTLAAELGFATAEALVRAAAAPDRDDVRDLVIARVSNGVTWFCREAVQLDAAVDRLRARCARVGLEDVYVWSAGCSTGEEPYTLAMSLIELGLRPRILATDISLDVLRRAATARYPRAALGTVPERWRDRFFVGRGDDTVELTADVRATVSFARHNVAGDRVPPDGWARFDLIVCRNVLIYFGPTEASQIIRRLETALRPTGELIVGAVERALQTGGDEPARARTAPVAPVPTSTRASAPRLPAIGGPTSPRAATIQGPAPAPAPSPAPPATSERGLDAVAHLRQGIADKRADRLESAIEHLRRARFLAADKWLAPYQLGLCLEAAGRPGEAREAYQHALAVVARGGRAGLPEAELDSRSLATTVTGACHARLAAIRDQLRSPREVR